jgi:hypothetical protein
MSTPRDSSSSVPIPGGIWVTGGFDGRNILKTTEKVFLNKTTQLATSLPAARYAHCLVNFEDKIISTGGRDENYDATSNVWQFNPANNYAKADGPEMKKTRYLHGCGIVHSIHHGSRPLLVVAGSYLGSMLGSTGAKNSEFWDFTIAGSTWQLCSKSCSFFSYYT